MLSREDNSYLRAPPDFAVDNHIAAVACRDRFDYCQTEPHVLPRTRAGLIDAVETIEDPWQMFSRNSAARVADADRHLALVCTCIHRNGAARRGMGNRVGYEVPYRLLKERAIDLGMPPNIRMNPKNNTGVGRGRPVEFLYLRQFKTDIDPLAFKALRGGVGPSEKQQCLD